MTPLEAYNKLNTAIELVLECEENLPRDSRFYIGEIVIFLTHARDSIKLPRQDAQVTLDSVKIESESGEIG